MIQSIKYLLPTYWASALINDDYSGMEDREIIEIKKFLDNTPGYPVDVDFQTEGFYSYNDAGTLAGDCAVFTFLIDK